jgi:beta-ribofuranosylaminobenzene 5'-phosphate synthase
LEQIRCPVSASVTVRVSARLHLGFLDLNGGLGRRFGSIGLALDGLGTTLTLARAAEGRAMGPDSARAAGHLASMQRALDTAESFALAIEEAVPAHAGLGSGTQIALAVAAALRSLHDFPLDLSGDAVRLQRGSRSGLGIGLFAHGGLIVDGGRGTGTAPAPIISRMVFPEPWRVLVVLDPARQGIHGAQEDAAFARLTPQPAERAAHACRLVLMQALPALAECDFISFGAAITQLQNLGGDYFAPLQGGARFASPRVAAALALLEREGAAGIGQSSWGPTGFCFAPAAAEAERLARVLREDRRGEGLDIRVCRGLNRGAEVKTCAAARELRD